MSSPLAAFACTRYDEGGLSVQYLLQVLPSKEPAGTVRIVPSKMKIGRLCLLPDYRKHGFGSELMRKAHEYLQSYLAEHHLKEVQVALHSQLPVVPFYARCVASAVTIRMVTHKCSAMASGWVIPPWATPSTRTVLHTRGWSSHSTQHRSLKRQRMSRT